MNAQPVIATHGLSKDYGSGRGVFELDLKVEPGEVFGFLGPNGAGKSTTMRLVQQSFHALLGEVSAQGRTVFLSSHTLSEVERVWRSSSGHPSTSVSASTSALAQAIFVVMTFMIWNWWSVYRELPRD